MSQYNVGAHVERVAMDILGPLPESESGNRYLLLVPIISQSGQKLILTQIKRQPQLQ